MTQAFAKLISWIKVAALRYLLILAVLVAGAYVTHSIAPEIKKLGILGVEEKEKAKQSAVNKQCDAYKNERKELEKLSRYNISSKIPGTESHKKDKALKAAIAACDLQLSEIHNELSNFAKAQNSSFLIKEVFPAFWTALFVLLGLSVAPYVLKTVFYFVLAPIASSYPPIHILPDAKGNEYSSSSHENISRISEVSQSIILASNQELLVHSDFLQSTPLHAKKSTKWLLNNAIPISSISSGMYMLTRVENSMSDPVVVSSTKDHLSEIGIIELPEGAAFVCQPRSLVGVVQDRDNPIRISRHWRLGSIQSWLTLQLRFVVFHGPGRLIIKGGRGIRMETARAARLINQNATLGFSANLNYANTRCETFVSYFRGQEELFNDLFTGEKGVYIYEEIATNAAGSTGVARPLEGFTDSVLKVFGI